MSGDSRTMNDVKINKTKVLPLRWFANMCGSIAGWAIMNISYYDELEDFNWRYKLHYYIWKTTWPIYYRFGTFYEIIDFDFGADGWNDYDENGVPYWEQTGAVDPDYFPSWDYVDEETGDAFRLINK